MAKKTAADPKNEFIPPAMDYAAHEGTYQRFTNLVKWSIIGVAIGTILLYFIIQP
jgi:hypothetical protein